MKLYDLIAMAEMEAKSRLAEQGLGDDYSAGRTRAIAKQIAIATIKFADLSNHRTTDYIFDLERLLQVRGQDRALSSVRGGAHQIHPAQGARRRKDMQAAIPAIHSPRNADLAASSLAGRRPARGGGRANGGPNILCDYAFTLAQNSAASMRPPHSCRKPTTGLRGKGWAFARGCWR